MTSNFSNLKQIIRKGLINGIDVREIHKTIVDYGLTLPIEELEKDASVICRELYHGCALSQKALQRAVNKLEIERDLLKCENFRLRDVEKSLNSLNAEYSKTLRKLKRLENSKK